jgi:hypothetical protein
MVIVTNRAPSGPRVFRLAYASQISTTMDRPSVVALAADAARNNRQNRVSGVLFCQNDTFLQWLEGPADDVCSLMERISPDPRHKDVSVLSAGWMPARRYPAWPMQLADQTDFERLYEADRAMLAFDAAAERHRFLAANAIAFDQEAADLAQQLVACNSERLPSLPKRAQRDLHERAQLVDALCTAFHKGWQDDLWSGTEIAIAVANLTRLWRQTGSICEPLSSSYNSAVVVPPGSEDVLGAMVVTDLLRASGMATRLIVEPDLKTTLAAVSHSTPKSVVVAGPLFALAKGAARAPDLAKMVRARFPKLAVHVGGTASGPLCDWPDRLAWRRDATGTLPAANIGWLALSALATVSADTKRAIMRVPPGQQRSLH